MPPVVQVTGDPTTLVPLGDGRFLVRLDDGAFPAPQLVLTGGTLVAARIPAARGPSPAAERAVTEAWDTNGSGRIDQGLLFPDDTRPPVDLAVTWAITWRPDPAAADEEFEMAVDFTFTTEPARAPVAAGPLHPGFVAVDFGTSTSTVTLFDQRERHIRALAVVQAARLRDGLLELINATPETDPELSAAGAVLCAAMVERVARVCLPNRPGSDVEGPTGSALAAALAVEDLQRPGEPALLNAVAVQLEHERAASREPLTGWLTARLDRCYDDTFATPALDRLLMSSVELDTSGRTMIPSRVEVRTTQPLSVRMGEELDGDGQQPATAVHGLKNFLGKPEDLDVRDDRGREAAVSTDALIGQAMAYLVEQSDGFVAKEARGAQRGRIARAVITYPTIAPPLVRRRLRELMTDPDGANIPHATTEYDEAVAAVLFFLMRDLGGEFTHVVEAVRARFEPIGQAWQQNVLVVDVGGGTTDIALVTLTLRDETTSVPGTDDRWTGRYYTLTPEVRGSTGHLQLGGDYLTLRIFRHVKAAVADHLLTSIPALFTKRLAAVSEHQQRSGAYLPGSLISPDPGLAGDRDPLGDEVEKVLPTRWPADDTTAEPTFWLLWKIAEQVKTTFSEALAAAEKVVIGADDLAAVLASTTEASDEHAPTVTPLELEPQTIAELVDAPVREVVRLATELAVNSLRPDEVLGRIILTGRSSALPQVREAVLTDFGRVVEDGRSVRWRAGDVTVENEYAKLATSIGACWAHSIRNRRRKREAHADRLAKGISHLWIDVRNLSFNLPCTFSLGLEPPEPLITAGTRLLQIDPDQLGKARGRWVGLIDSYDVHRMTDTRWGPMWGTFQWDRHEPGFVPDDGVWPGEIMAQLEVTQELELAVLLCRGPVRHHLVEPASVNVAAAADPGEPFAAGDGDRRTVRLPGDLVVEGFVGGSGERDPEVVFAASDALQDDLDPSAVLRVFASPPDSDPDRDPDRDPDDEGVAAVLSAELPASPDGWTFALRMPGGAYRDIGHLDPPALGDSEFPTRYRASLDAEGNVRVHAGEIPYVEAASLEEVQRRSGRVYRARLEEHIVRRDPARDPFNGKH